MCSMTIGVVRDLSPKWKFGDDAIRRKVGMPIVNAGIGDPDDLPRTVIWEVGRCRG